MNKLIPYGQFFIDKKDIIEVNKSLRGKFITSGPYVKKLEELVKKKLNVSHCISCSSGTAALHLAFLSLDLKKNDVIIMPIINFIASTNILNLMNRKIFFADVDEFTGQITPETIKECIKKNKLKKIKVILTMYLGGSPDNVLEFYKLKKKYKCYIIEDACHALGASYKNKKNINYIGSCKHSDICTFSLHPLKSITSGEGGLITTNNKHLSEKIKLLRSHGFTKKNHWKFNLNMPGLNYRLSDINCALAYSQLHKLELFIKKREQVAKKYNIYFKKNPETFFVRKLEKKINSAWHLFLLKINFRYLNSDVNSLIKHLKKKKIIVQQHYTPIYNFDYYNNIKKKNFLNAQKYYETTISLPIFYKLNNKNLKRIFNEIKIFLLRKTKIKMNFR